MEITNSEKGRSKLAKPTVGDNPNGDPATVPSTGTSAQTPQRCDERGMVAPKGSRKGY